MKNEAKKVGVATYHYSYNEGALLQAYATTQVLKNMAGIRGEIIDQRYPAKVEVYGRPDNDRKVALLDAVNEWLPLSEKKFRQNEDLSSVYEYINSTYDKLIVGSDVVWNLKYKRRFRRLLGKGILPSQSIPFYTPFPNLYWPDRALKVPVYAYAAAIGTLEYDQIPRADQKRMQASLRQFSRISVRDERTHRFVEFIDPVLAKDVVIVPDPTFGIDLDYSGIEALKIKLQSWGVDFDKPICCFLSKDHPVLETFSKYVIGKGYQTVSLSTQNDFSEVNLYDKYITPVEWSVIFSLFDFCVTERMHGAIFCLKNGLPFVAIDINETKKDNDSKIINLMRQFELSEFVLPKSKLNFEELKDLFNEFYSKESLWSEAINGKLEFAMKTTSGFIQSIVKD